MSHTADSARLAALFNSELNQAPPMSHCPSLSLPVSSQDRGFNLLLTSDLNNLACQPSPHPPVSQDRQLDLLLASDLNDLPRRPPASPCISQRESSRQVGKESENDERQPTPGESHVLLVSQNLTVYRY
jgi:hypothetical protein